MILEFLLNLIFNLLEWLFLALPDIQWNVEEGVMGSFFDLIAVVFYIFPMDTFLTLFAIIIAITNFRIIISIVKTIWNLLPFV